MAQPCTEDFVINVAGGEIPCEMTVDPDNIVHNYDIENVRTGRVIRIPFTYKVGKPKRTVFASSYTKSRTGGTPDTEPPQLGARVFSPAPNQNSGPTDVNAAQFIVSVGGYYHELEEALDTGTDTYNIILYLREANVRIGGTNPPPNLQPPNPM